MLWSYADHFIFIGNGSLNLCMAVVDTCYHYRSRTNAITLQLDNLDKMDEAIKEWYPLWVQNAPEQYKTDNFLLNRIPVAVTSLYGQNQPLPVSQEDDVEESANWSRSRNFNRIRYISFSLATHFESVLLCQVAVLLLTVDFVSVLGVTEWITRNSDEIEDMHRDGIFDSYDTETRNQVTSEELARLDLLDDLGMEIPIYSQDGYRIHRRLGARSHDTHPHGVLMNLRHLDEIFLPEDLFGDFDPTGQSTSYNVYPQAGLVTAGHFQADGLISAFLPLLHQLNTQVELQGDAMIEDDPLSTTQPHPILGIGCQGYNAVMHVTRGRCAQHHDAQKGLVTSALAGSWAKTTVNLRKARSKMNACNNLLPHEEFREKIENDTEEPIDCSLRLENTYVVDLNCLAPQYRNGGYVLSCHLAS